MTKNTWKSILKLSFVCLIIVGICVGAYFLAKAFGINSIEGIQKVCNNSIVGALIFFAIQVFQVLFLPIGNLAFTIPAGIIFGPVKGFLITWLGITVGSILMYYVGRYGGGKLLNWIVGKDKAEHYKKIIEKATYLLPVILLIPIFPDDVICASAGLGKIKAPFFWITIIITRGIDTFCACFIGAEAIKSPLGIALLVVFLAVILICALLVTKYRVKVEAFFVNLFTGKLKNNKRVFKKREPINVYTNKYVAERVSSRVDLSFEKFIK